MSNNATLFLRACLLVIVGACSESGVDSRNPKGATGGTISISASADADALIPPLILSLQGKQVADQIFDNLADIGPGLNVVGDEGFTPRLASTWRWPADSTYIEFGLNPAARWHDGVPVRAEDVRFTFALVKDTTLGSPLSSNLDNVDSVTTPDSLTARVWLHSKSPDAFFKVATPVPILPYHLLKGVAPAGLRTAPYAQKPIGSGRFRFSSWERSSKIVLTADSANYRHRPLVDRAIWLVAPDYTTAATRFLRGEADFLDVVKPEYVAQAKQQNKNIIVTNGSLDYGYVAFNLGDATRGKVHPLFSSRELRRALIMAADRPALVRSVFDTLAVVGHGPATRALATSDPTIGLPVDTAAAAKTLDSLGWKRGARNMRSKNGVPLAFALMVPSSSAIRMKFAVLLQEQWRQAGADVRIESLDPNSFADRMENRKFDVLLNAWHIDPTPSSVREEWASSEIRKGGYNATSYRSRVFDAVVDSAIRETSPARAVTLYRQAYRILTDDGAAMWLYELRNVHGASKRIATSGIRNDGWWQNLADWSVVSPK
ncbi:MAG TPA: peptide ABC transporter substrate-binding protein [Gemmatimonadaceae bacterium]|nr:peptide ABC transporter substrate-binding protein [Gemmatimonadaceae bacterium]